MLGGRARLSAMISNPDPLVVYAMVTALIVALAVGLFFVVRQPGVSDVGEPTAGEARDGPWSTATASEDEKWPEPRSDLE